MTNASITLATSAVLVGVLASGCDSAQNKPVAAARAPITVQEVNDAQQGWCNALLSIAKAHAEGKDYQSIATAVLSNNYNY
ncbi:MAG: hypothetical protein QG590_1066, partial [Pseudomonadota bacterium]|nr:hypothetical protein [Pseudomonadota bacterium]